MVEKAHRPIGKAPLSNFLEIQNFQFTMTLVLKQEWIQVSNNRMFAFNKLKKTASVVTQGTSDSSQQIVLLAG